MHRLADHRFLEKRDNYFNRKSRLRYICSTDGGARTGTVFYDYLDDDI